MADGAWQMTDGRWCVADGRWQMADGRWQMADGRWQMADGRGCTGHRVLTSAFCFCFLLLPSPGFPPPSQRPANEPTCRWLGGVPVSRQVQCHESLSTAPNE